MIWKFDATDARVAGKAKAAILKTISRVAEPSADLVLFELVFSELVGNVARHAPKTAIVSFEWSDDGFVLHVADCGPGFSNHGYLPENPLSESGRGLFMVETLSKKLEVKVEPTGGSRVSAWLPIYCAPSAGLVPSSARSAYSLG